MPIVSSAIFDAVQWALRKGLCRECENVFVEGKLVDQESAKSRLAGQMVPENRHRDHQLKGKKKSHKEATNARSQPLPQGGPDAGRVRKLKSKRAFGFEGEPRRSQRRCFSARGSFVGSSNGTVQAMNPKGACLYWTFQSKRTGAVGVTDGTEWNESSARVWRPDRGGSPCLMR
jgi:hypothetical protein